MELKELRKASNPFPMGLALMISDLGWLNMTNKVCGVDEADVASYRNIELMACWSSVTSDLLMQQVSIQKYFKPSRSACLV
jgi:hypothetical protein